MGNVIGIHAGVFVGGWQPGQARRAIELAAQTGYDLIEIPAFNAAGLDVDATRRYLGESGLEVSCSLGLPMEADIASSEEGARAAGEQLLNEAVDFAAAIGSRYVGGVIHSGFGKHPAPVTDHGRANSVETMRRVCRRAGEHGITIGLEAVNRYESHLLNTAAQTCDYINEVGEPNLSAHLDTYHMNIEEVDPYRAILDTGDRLGYFHIGESNRGAPGAGTVDFDKSFAALDELGYEGVITFESFSSAVLDPNLSNTLAIWRNTWTDPVACARQARGFIAEHGFPIPDRAD